MKRILMIVMSFIVMTGIYAQGGGTAPLAKGQVQLNFGTGLTDYGIPTYFSVDIALHKDVTLTPEVHVRFPFDNHDFSGGVMCKADYHWNYLIGIPPNWDFYAGARAGFNFSHDPYPDLGMQVGGRWYWSQGWGMNLELAVGLGYGITFGLSKKL